MLDAWQLVSGVGEWAQQRFEIGAATAAAARGNGRQRARGRRQGPRWRRACRAPRQHSLSLQLHPARWHSWQRLQADIRRWSERLADRQHADTNLPARCLPRLRSPPLPLPAPQVKRADVPLELEEIGLPMNTFGPKNPFTGKIISVETITGPKAGGETCHIIIQTDKKIPFVEGQSYGVIPPGTKVRDRVWGGAGGGGPGWAACVLAAAQGTNQ